MFEWRPVSFNAKTIHQNKMSFKRVKDGGKNTTVGQIGEILGQTHQQLYETFLLGFLSYRQTAL